MMPINEFLFTGVQDMTRAKLLIIGLGLAMVAAFAGPAAAQDGPAITVDPTSVDAAGTVAVSVSGTGYTQPALFVLPCTYPEGGDVALLSSDDCDLTALTPVSPDADGAFEITIEYDIPAEGLAIVAADAGQVEQAAAVISVGAAEETPTPEPEVVEEAQELPETGSENAVMAIVGLTLAAAGAVVLGGGRRLGRI